MKNSTENNKCWRIVKHIKIVCLIFVFSFAIPFFAFYLINEFVFCNATFEEGYTVCGVDLSGLTADEAEQKLSNIAKNTEEDLSLTLTYGSKEWKFGSNDFEIHSNIHIVLEELQKSNRKPSVNKAKLIRKIKNMGFDSKIATNYVLLGIDEKLDNIALEIDTTPISACAKYNYNKNTFDIIPETFGTQLDKEKVYDDIVNGLKFSPNIKIDISTKNVLPKFTSEDILKSTKKQSEFSTSYANSNMDRKNNIKLAVNQLNEYQIMPNETFSFNNVVGKRTVDKGYKEANIIKDGVFVKGVGGGICQVSTTLYNALLLANIEVSEAHKHSLPVSYVEPCLDAMVSWSTADLKFTNTSSLPIYIIGHADGNKITFKIYGDTNKENYTIKTKGVILRTIPAGKDKIIPDKTGRYSDKIMFKGEFLRVKQAKNGYEAKSYIEYYKNGELVKSKQLRHATYDAQPGILYEGCESLPEGMTIPKENLTIDKNTIVND